MLYPLQFAPRLKKLLWGSESWEISAVESDVSVVKGGLLDSNPLDELVEVYMGDLVGDKVYERFGEEFPLLVKIIEARERLSVQVHPTDEIAAARHGAYGKTEMWYILSREPGARLFIGFREGVTREVYAAAVADGSVGGLLNEVPVEPGDAFFIPAGTVHAIGEGIVLAEVQQTSDVTYRIFDWNRVGADGKPRELHTEWALDAIDFAAPVRRVTRRPPDGRSGSVGRVAIFHCQRSRCRRKYRTFACLARLVHDIHLSRRRSSRHHPRWKSYPQSRQRRTHTRRSG